MCQREFLEESSLATTIPPCGPFLLRSSFSSFPTDPQQVFWWAWRWPKVLGSEGKSQHLGLGELGAALSGGFGLAAQSQQLFGFIL